jgi:hypothetical protein
MSGSFIMNMNKNYRSQKNLYKLQQQQQQQIPNQKQQQLKQIPNPNIYMFSAPNPTRSFSQLDFGGKSGCGCGS